ncbi:MAG: HEAT repeat domain-containing protein, partial [Candidatus Heimdallarchaeota archaeon]|nr:HEAT repeat domain-containing protein [Candidatus Heimdallarchaeota archaeon]
GYAKGLSHTDPYVRAAAAIGIDSFSMRAAYYGYQPDEKLMNQLARMAQDKDPLVKIEAATAYLGWFHKVKNKEKLLAEIIVDAVDLLDHQDKYIRKRAFDLCEKVGGGGFHEIDILGEKFIDALVNKIKNSENEEARSKARYYLGAASYHFRSKRALDFMLKDFETHPEDYDGYPPHLDLIVLLNAKEYIPFLKQNLSRASEENKGMLDFALMELGVDVYENSELSSPNRVAFNFWKAIEQEEFDKARKLLDASRFNEKVINVIIDEHKEVWKHFRNVHFKFHLTEEAEHFPGIYCEGEEGYGDQDFGRCLEDVYLLQISIPGGTVFDYYFKKKNDVTWLIHEIKPK